MTFFYDLNKRLASIADKPQTQQLNERDMSRAAKGYEKYGKEGMEALSKAGQDGASEATMDRIRAKHNKYKKSKTNEEYGPLEELSSALAQRAADAADQRAGDISRAQQDMTMSNSKRIQPAVNAYKAKQQKFTDYAKKAQDREAAQQAIDAAPMSAAMKRKLGLGEEYGPLEELSSALAKRAADAADRRAGDISTAQQGMTMTNAKRVQPAVNAYKAKQQKFTDYAKKAQDREAGQQAIDAAPMSAAMKRKLGLGEEGGVPMTPKQKSFAKLAPPKDKITFADKIAGAKKEVDEMLGDVAAEAMKGALKGGQKKLDRNHNGQLDAEDFAMLRKGAGKQETDETRNRDLEDYYGFNEPKSSTKGQVHRGTYGTEYQGEPDEDDDIGQKKVKKAKSAVPSGEKRGRGRPSVGAGKGKKIGAKGPGVKSKLLTKEADHDSDEVKQAMAVLKKAGYKISKGEEELEEKAVSQQQQKFMGMAHAMQKGEKIKGASAELKKVARTMKPKDVEDFAATKHKGLPKKKTKAKEEVEETTVSGSVATAPEAPKSKGKGGMTFGKGIYDSMNRELEAMIAESMNIDMHIGQDENGQPNKALTVNATDEDAIYLGKLLKMAGVGGSEGQGCGCGQSPCACNSAEQVDENQPDWPTETETSDDALQYAGGLNKPKTTIAGDGQTTVPVTAVQVREGEDQGVAEGQAPTYNVIDVKTGKSVGTFRDGAGFMPGANAKAMGLKPSPTVPNGYKVDYKSIVSEQGVAEGLLDEQEQVMAPESKESELDEELQRIREMAGIREAAKPDKDGNKKESMKKAADDAESDKKVEESILDMTRLWKAYKG